MVKHNKGLKFDKKDYYKNPQNYRGIFQEIYLPCLSVVINCIYWADKFPRLITKKYLKNYVKNNELRLLAISDITCDYMGSIELLTKFTTIDKPFFVYHPENESISEDYTNQSKGILYNSIENMPTQFPYDASTYFGKKLFPFLEPMIRSDINKPLDQQNLPPEIKRAVITHNGQLTYLFSYIKKLRKQKEDYKKKNLKEIKDFRQIDTGELYTCNFKGHLFDTHAINELLDCLVDKYHSLASITRWKVGYGEGKPSSCTINLKSIQDIDSAEKDIQEICKKKDIKYDIVAHL